MAKVLYPIAACLKKADTMDKSITDNENSSNDDTQMDSFKEDVPPQSGLISKVSSGLFNIGSGAVGLGVGGIKWAANTTINVGSSVLNASKTVVSKVGITSVKQKPKNE